ncbi:unnamed protein product [Adineta steineri]|uniref:Uncharacterized protein n=1 Tax=Adineta steineri TaxID=433720 RepID=A0A818TAR4_9BILA|nr:unnamed protein product [Adineta steineri]CAF3677302.1 unnamed protein product [Adineta steineri]
MRSLIKNIWFCHELQDVTLPYPLQLDEEYIYRIELKPKEFINYCQVEAMNFMFNDPIDFIDSFIKDRLGKGLDIGINQECLDHLNNIRQVYPNNESFEHDVYDYIEVQIMKLIDSPDFESPLEVAVSKARRSGTLGGIICFQPRDIEFHQFNIQELHETTEEYTDPLEWCNFVKLCRRRFAEYPHMFRRDTFRGSICNNAEKVYRREYERPQ